MIQRRHALKAFTPFVRRSFIQHAKPNRFFHTSLQNAFAVRVDQQGTQLLFKNKPSKQQRDSAKNKPKELSVEDMQSANIQSLMKILITLEQEQSIQQQASKETDLPSDALANLESASSMATYAFFRAAAAHRTWIIETSVSYEQPENEGILLKLRMFSNQRVYTEYKKLFGEKREFGDAFLVDNLAYFIECLMLKEERFSETDPVKIKEIEDKVHTYPYFVLMDSITHPVQTILIDDRTDHTFKLDRQYFKSIMRWRTVLQVETALHTIRLWGLPSELQNSFDESEYLDAPAILEDPIQVLLDHPKYFIISQEKGWLSIPNENDTTETRPYIPVFTAPDLAYQFADQNDIEHSRVRVVTGSNLFRILNQNIEKIGGVFFNAGHALPQAINQELALSREFIQQVHEIDIAEEEEDE